MDTWIIIGMRSDNQKQPMSATVRDQRRHQLLPYAIKKPLPFFLSAIDEPLATIKGRFLNKNLVLLIEEAIDILTVLLVSTQRII